MKSIVNETYCSRIVEGDGWAVGELKGSRMGDYKWLGELRKNTLCGRFDGLRTYIDVVDKKNRTFGWHTEYDSSKDRRDDDWTRFPSYETAIKAFRETPEVFRSFTESDIKLKDWETAGNDVEYGTTGDFLDIGRVMSGEPEAFGVMRDGNIINRFCSIIVNACLTWNVTKDEAEEKAKRIARLVDMLEHNHVRCQVVAIWSDNVSHVEVTVKKYGDILDLDDLSVVFSADLLRRTGFRFKERSKTCEGGYGHVSLWGENALKMFKDETADHVITIDGFNGGNKSIRSTNEAFDRLEKQIAEKFDVGDNYNVEFC